MASVTYYFIFKETTNKASSFSRCITPYLYSQIVRYLPGKVWGIIYQAKQVEDHISAHLVWETNLAQFILGTAASGIAITWVFFQKLLGPWPAGLLLAILLLAYFILLKNNIYHAITRYITKHFKKDNQNTSPLQSDQSSAILASLLAEWGFYFFAWIILLQNLHPIDEIVIISILYVASWIIGFVVIVLPSGILVRESTFVGLGMIFGYDPGMMTFYAILGRLLFSVSDIINTLLAYAFFKKNQACP